MSGHQGVDAAVPGRAALPQPTPPLPQRAPQGGPVGGWARTRTPHARTDAPPPPTSPGERR
jgi:hypothetical protein